MIRFVDRLGLALVAPRRAMAEAEAGRGGASDLLLLLGLKILCGETRSLVGAAWTALAQDVLAGLGALVRHVQVVVGMDLLVWALSGVLITTLAGRTRKTGRDFDLAAVAWVPLLAVDVVAGLIVSATGVTVPRGVSSALRLGALAWVLTWDVLAVLHARARSAS